MRKLLTIIIFAILFVLPAWAWGASIVDFNSQDYVVLEDVEIIAGVNVGVDLDGTNNIIRYCLISGGATGIIDSGGTNSVYASVFDTQTDDAVVVTVAGSTFYHLTIYSPTDDGFDLQANAVINNTIFEAVGGTDIFENGGTNAPAQTNYATADGDPLFVNPVTCDFHLQNSSPARRGAASGTGVELDYDGVPYRTQALRSLGPFQNEYRTGLTIN